MKYRIFFFSILSILLISFSFNLRSFEAEMMEHEQPVEEAPLEIAPDVDLAIAQQGAEAAAIEAAGAAEAAEAAGVAEATAAVEAGVESVIESGVNVSQEPQQPVMPSDHYKMLQSEAAAPREADFQQMVEDIEQHYKKDPLGAAKAYEKLAESLANPQRPMGSTFVRVEPTAEEASRAVEATKKAIEKYKEKYDKTWLKGLRGKEYLKQIKALGDNLYKMEDILVWDAKGLEGSDFDSTLRKQSETLRRYKAYTPEAEEHLAQAINEINGLFSEYEKGIQKLYDQGLEAEAEKKFKSWDEFTSDPAIKEILDKHDAQQKGASAETVPSPEEVFEPVQEPVATEAKTEQEEPSKADQDRTPMTFEKEDVAPFSEPEVDAELPEPPEPENAEDKAPMTFEKEDVAPFLEPEIDADLPEPSAKEQFATLEDAPTEETVRQGDSPPEVESELLEQLESFHDLSGPDFDLFEDLFSKKSSKIDPNIQRRRVATVGMKKAMAEVFDATFEELEIKIDRALDDVIKEQLLDAYDAGIRFAEEQELSAKSMEKWKTNLDRLEGVEQEVPADHEETAVAEESKKAPKLPPLTTVEDVLQPDLLSHSQDSHGAKTPKSNSMASVAEKANQKLIDDILRHDDVPPKYTEENLSKKSYSELKNLYDDLKDGDDWDDD